MPDTEADRIAELEEAIQEARDAYYNNDPTISDAIFDAWVDELSSLKPDSLALLEVGAPIPATTSWQKVAHKIPMGSLDKVNTPEELMQWVLKGAHSKASLFITEKLDGISISVEYVDGRLFQGVTRGDGSIGEDITSNVARMQGVLKNLDKPLSVVLRGEIVLRKPAFKEHFSDKANPRNAASGTAKRLDGYGTQHLTIFFYEVHGIPGIKTEQEQFQWLTDQTFLVPNWFVGQLESDLSPQSIWESYQESKRDLLDYDIDGLVVRFNDLEHQQSLGVVHGRPKGAVAFKFNSPIKDTWARDLIVQVGGTGRQTPVAVLDPVNLVGAEVSRASLYNWAYIKKIGFHIGAKVSVIRANDVIPRVVEVLKAVGEPEPPPTTCAACGHPLEWEGEYLVCHNVAECPAQVEGRLKQWVTSLGILEWGDALIEKVVQLGVTDVPGLYGLTQGRLEGLERMGASSAKKALDQLWGVLPLPLEALVGALGVPLCATSTMELVVQAGYDTLSKLKGVTFEELQQIPGFGPKRAQSLIGWLQRHGGLLDEMVAAGITIREPIIGTLTGKSFCFTGKMENKRPFLERLVKEAGGQVKDRVGKGLDYLVLSDPNSSSSKAVSARKYGTQCISEKDFLSMVAV